MDRIKYLYKANTHQQKRRLICRACGETVIVFGFGLQATLQQEEHVKNCKAGNNNF